MASSVAGHRRAFGADMVPQCYDDLELADLVVLVGSNAAWCHPVLYQRIQTARGRTRRARRRIDPRRTATSEGADLHLAIRPGTDARAVQRLLVWLAEQRRSTALHRRATRGLRRGLSARALIAPSRGDRRCNRPRGSATSRLLRAGSPQRRASSCYCQGVNQSAQGTDKVNAMINCIWRPAASASRARARSR